MAGSTGSAAIKPKPQAGKHEQGPAAEATATDEKSPAKSSEEPLHLITEPDDATQVAIEATSFKGVVPGASTPTDVKRAWGQPKKTARTNGSEVQLYSVEPFKRVEVNYTDGKVTSIVIRLDRPFAVDMVTKFLDLTKIRPVSVLNDLGEVLGRAYPERGVLLGFEPSDKPGKASMKVSQIVLEPISAETFVLRAEAMMNSRNDLSRGDLEQALSLDPRNAKALWLYSRVLAGTDQRQKASKAAAEAVRLEPENAQYRVTYAQALAQDGLLNEASAEVQKAIAGSTDRPHVKARALCLAGDLLASGPKPDFRKALAMHNQAIQLADPLAASQHPAIRIAAKEVLVDAHLGGAHDIAWGDWKEPGKAVARWIDRATSAATDLVKNEGVPEELLLRVHTRSLAAYVGVRGDIDPAPAARQVVVVGEKLIAAAGTAEHKAQLQCDVGTALYDAVQIYQMRTQPDLATKQGEVAVQFLAESVETHPTTASTFLLGRLYFRLGTIESVQRNDHKAAVAWFDKAAPIIESATAEDLVGSLGRQGESLVIMGVSYWNVNQREKAISITQHGIKWMEQAFEQGTLDQSALVVPYGNLALMHRKIGAEEMAKHFQELASRAKAEKLR